MSRDSVAAPAIMESNNAVASVELVTIDDYGDLILRVGGSEAPDRATQPKDFKVDSGTLRRTSPVFRAMLFGPWVESSKPVSSSKQWTIELPEDDPGGFTILMGIAHASHKLVPVPSKWTEETVNAVVILADKYDMLHLLSLFVPSMLQAIRRSPKNRIDCDTFLNLQSSWELGSEEDFARELKIFVFFICLDKDDPTQLTDRHYTYWQAKRSSGPGPHLAELLAPDISHQVATARRSILRELVDFINTEHDRCFHSKTACQLPMAVSASFWSSALAQCDIRSRERCQSTISDGLQAQFNEVKSRPNLPIVDVEEIRRSVKGFYQSSQMGFNLISVPKGHKKTCSLANRFRTLLTSIRKSERWEPENFLTPEQREWMKKRRESIGY